MHEAGLWVRQIDLPIARLRRPKPRPLPPAGKRPKVYSISDIATLITDPYAIYARKVLNLVKLDGLDEESDASQFGEIVHDGLARFFAESSVEAVDAKQRLCTALDVAMQKTRPRAALAQWWSARLERIATWLLEAERERIAANGAPLHRALECKGAWHLPDGFVINGRADRLECDPDGEVRVIDYKTGMPPSEAAVKAGTAPQLPLEAVMAEQGCFGEAFAAKVKALLYVRLSGRAVAGDEKPLFENKPDDLHEVLAQAATQVPALLKRFAAPSVPFLTAPHPKRDNKYDDYAGLSRRAEWGGDDDETGTDNDSD